jgi:hypothetical protein
MSTRPVKLTVQNNLNVTLTLKSKSLDHGKFTEDPPATIESEGYWSCSARDGSTIGAEGNVTYENKEQGFEIEFYFNHPFGSATSSYRVTPTPADSMGYDIKGSFKGHDQKITYVLYPA